MGERLRSVRLRITLVATLVTGLAMLLAGSWLVTSVEQSQIDRLHDTAERRLAIAQRAIEAGQLPSTLELAALGGGSTYMQIVRLPDGRVIAASPGLADVPALTTMSEDGEMVRVEGGGQVGALPPGRLVITEQLVETPGGEVAVLAASPFDSVGRSVDAVQEGLLVAFPLLLVAVGLLAWFLAGRALRPVEAIRNQVEAISATTLDRRVPVPRSGDEVARLADTMNAMLDRLEDASTRQQRFVADASHELRSPVAAIRTELEVAQRTAAAEDWPLVAERLLAEEARLEAVIADLLLLASLDEGAASEHVVVDVAELAVEEARRRVPDREGVTVEVDAPAPALVHASRVQLRRAIANLLDNAGRHADATVRLGVHQRDGRVRVLVDDDGP
ncbi:MAG TPA: histidine kinase dimerization/phospho-acceptor domain-containing protein, partial [Acidimicrobiales bacterium]|nr:histidine kinase dimerization/phospho-acceptor domain-containing protein [Acidimicrobiales bacterium]